MYWIWVRSRWKKTDAQLLRQKGMIPFLLSLSAALVLPLFLAESLSWESYSLIAVITLGASFWVVSMSIEDLWQKLSRSGFRWHNIGKLSASYWGMQCAHIGIAVCALGVGLSSVYDVQKDVRMVPGDRLTVAGYEFSFDRLDPVQGPNFVASRGQISAYKNDRLVATL